jgi:thioredoxin 2
MSSTLVGCESCGTKNRVPSAAAGAPRCGRCRADLPWIVDAGDESFAEVVDESKVPVLVDMWAPWCGPCRMVSLALESLAKELAGRLKLVKVNVDESPKLAERFGVQGIPTLLVMQGGKVAARQTGAAPESALREWLERSLGASP